MPNPEVRYCTTEDGVRIAYCVEGEGPPAIALPPFVDSFVTRLKLPPNRRLYDALVGGRTVVNYDPRGVGLSERNVSDLSIEANTLDIVAVKRAIDAEQVSLFATMIGGLFALAYAALHPEGVSHLVLYETIASAQDLMTADQLRSFAQLCRANWHVAAQTLSDMSIREQHPEFSLEQARGYEEGASGEHVARLIEAGMDWDGSALFGSITAKTLVLHKTADPYIPFTAAQKIAAGIPGARLVPLEGSDPHVSFGDIGPAVEAIDAFVPKRRSMRRRAKESSATALRTVLFTDLVGHTEMMQRLGDEQGRALLREHERITRETLTAHAGEEIKTMGDGFMASFASVTKAVECAIALQRAFDSHKADVGAHGHAPLRIRVGLNAGEPIAEEGDLFGSTVILASRICAQAGAGEVLVPDTVRGLLSGKQFLFSDRGNTVLKGFEDPVRLYEVRWREGEV